MPDLSVWPTDGADGSVSSEARWRKMARVWAPSGVVKSGDLAPTLVAGPVINVAIGQAWIDGHLAELIAPAAVPASATGLLVVRFTPADNHAELLYRDGATVPTLTDATYELQIARMTAGAITDVRPFLPVPHAATTQVSTVSHTIATVVPALTDLTGILQFMQAPGLYLAVAQFDIDVTVLSAGNIIYGYLVPGGAATIISGTARTAMDMNAVRRGSPVLVETVSVGAGGGSLKMSGSKQAAGGTAAIVLGSTTGMTKLTVTRIG
jgi:hypothetical protein